MRVMHEAKRGCGFRKGGGLYLMSDGVGMDCPLLPVEMTVCPCCSHGIKPARGFTWVDPDKLLPHHTSDGYDHLGSRLSPHPMHPGCPLNAPGLMGEHAGLIWIGEQFYKTPGEWIAEGHRMGFSRRIPAVPRDFVAGETYVLVGHRKAIHRGFVDGEGREFDSLADAYLLNQPGDRASVKDRYVPGIFHLWRPSRIEYVVKGDETADELVALEKRGIEPVQVIPVYDEVVLPV